MMQMSESLQRFVVDLEEDERLDVLVEKLKGASKRLVTDRTRPALRGDAIGHAAHPMLTDLPLGCWFSAGLLDVLGGRRSRPAAQRLIGLGLLFVPPTVATGMNDWTELDAQRDRRVGAVHAVGNVMVAATYFMSWRARRAGHHVRGKALAMTGGVLAMGTGYLGGHLAFGRGERVESDVVDLTEVSEGVSVPSVNDIER